jgi:hypothetical protein
MFSITKTLSVLVAAALVSAEVAIDADVTLSFGGAAPSMAAPSASTTTFAVTIADGTASEWMGTMTDYPDWHKSHSKEPPKSYTSTVYTTTVYTVTACPTTIPNCPTGHVTTETITSTTIVCPVTTTPVTYPPTTQKTYPVTTPPVTYPTTTCLTTSYVAPPYSANSTTPYVKPTGTTSAKPSQFTGAANMVGGSLSLAAVVAFVVAAL